MGGVPVTVKSGKVNLNDEVGKSPGRFFFDVILFN
jgi:hypothetical protein